MCRSVSLHCDSSTECSLFSSIWVNQKEKCGSWMLHHVAVQMDSCEPNRQLIPLVLQCSEAHVDVRDIRTGSRVYWALVSGPFFYCNWFAWCSLTYQIHNSYVLGWIWIPKESSRSLPSSTTYTLTTVCLLTVYETVAALPSPSLPSCEYSSLALCEYSSLASDYLFCLGFGIISHCPAPW